jgi:hypothetical protein
MTNYAGSSPWFATEIKNKQYLDVLSIRPIPASTDDVLYTVGTQYTHRPDLLAYDLYGSSKYWWVFAQRNMEILKDPVYDLVAGIKIYLPQGPKLRQALGS